MFSTELFNSYLRHPSKFSLTIKDKKTMHIDQSLLYEDHQCFSSAFHLLCICDEPYASTMLISAP